MNIEYKNYVPLHREGFAPSRPNRDSVRGGSTRTVVDILSNSIASYENAIAKAHNAELHRTLYNLVTNNPNEDFWYIEQNPKMKADLDSSGNVKYVLDRALNNNEMEIWIDGKPKVLWMNFNNQHAMNLLNVLDKSRRRFKSSEAVQVLSKFNRMLAATNTSWFVEFLISNPIKDYQSAMVNVSDTILDDKRKSITKAIPQAMGAIKSVLRAKDNALPSSHPLYKFFEAFRKSGGQVGFIDFLGDDVKQKAMKLEKEIALEYGVAKGQKKSVAINKVRDLTKLVSDYNMIVENGIRLSTFKAHVETLAQQKGITVDEALKRRDITEPSALFAKEITVNFNKRGEYGPAINSLYLFANAGIQGSAKVISTLYRSKKARQIVGGAVLAAAVLALANRAVGDDDDKGESYYNSIDPFIKERNMVFMIPGAKDKYVKIPLAWGFNVFWNIGTEIGDALGHIMNGNTGAVKPMEIASRLTVSALNAFNPLQSSTLAQTLSPTVLDPIVNVAENKTWSGSPLMPENNPFDKTPKPDSQLYFDSARKPSVALANLLNTLSLGNEVKSGAIDISPETLDLVWDTFTGGAGRFIADTLMLPNSLYKAFDSDEKAQIKQFPIIRKVLGERSEWAGTKLYSENVNKLFLDYEEARVYPDAAKKLLNDSRKLILIKLAKDSESAIRKVRKAAKMSVNQTEDRQKFLDDRVTMLKDNFNSLYYKLNK